VTSRQTNRTKRIIAAIGLLLPLIALGPCTTTLAEATIDGFFNAFTPVLVNSVESRLYADANNDTTGDSTP